MARSVEKQARSVCQKRGEEERGKALTSAPASGAALPEAASTSTASVSASAQVVPNPPHTPHSSTSPACTQRIVPMIHHAQAMRYWFCSSSYWGLHVSKSSQRRGPRGVQSGGAHEHVL